MPLGLLVAIALGCVAPSLFLPALLIVVGGHFLVFISLYGMRMYGVLAGVLVVVDAVALFTIPRCATSAAGSAPASCSSLPRPSASPTGPRPGSPPQHRPPRTARRSRDHEARLAARMRG